MLLTIWITASLELRLEIDALRLCPEWIYWKEILFRHRHNDKTIHLSECLCS